MAGTNERCDELDRSWVVVVDGFAPGLDHLHASLLTVADGLVGTRGTREEEGPGGHGSVVVSGLYDVRPGRTVPELLPCPSWTFVDIGGARTDRRVLDLRTGVLWRECETDGGVVRSLRFACIARPGIVCLRLEGPRGHISVPRVLAGASVDGERSGSCTEGATIRSSLGGGVAVAASQTVADAGDVRTVERIAAYSVRRRGPPTVDAAWARLDAVADRGVTKLLAEQRSAWDRIWSEADVCIPHHPDLQLAARFAVFHLLASADVAGEAAVGARGLTGSGYAGHVFWDADVYVLPVLAALRPAAARAMLRYRSRRLAAAQRAAADAGYRGARFPWESAHDGTDVTPRVVTDPLGERVPIRTGYREEHIVADVAWGASHYAAWAGDGRFIGGPCRDLVVETARYWASRVRWDSDGSAHIYGVVGPDEYHEVVDDNAFTNVMARWNLRRAADVLSEQRDRSVASEASEMRLVADALVDGYDPATGIYEQFAGYHRLEPLLVADVAEPPIAADLLLGRRRIARSQIIKQADVLMLHHMVPDEVAPGSLAPNLAHYGPRTAHGSSLSPAVHAGLLSRAGFDAEAMAMLRIAARMDLDDLTGSSGAGLHLATMGGLWQALAFGVCGLRPEGDRLRADPMVPHDLGQLRMRLHFRGRRVSVDATPDRFTVRSDRPLTVRLPGAGCTTVIGPDTTFRRRDPSTWEVSRR